MDKASITLGTYQGLLRRISEGKVDAIEELEPRERRVAVELLRSDLISDNDKDGHEHKFLEQLSFPRIAPLAITPAGIAALESWEEQLKARSPWNKLSKGLIQFLWLLTGSILASIPKLFDKF